MTASEIIKELEGQGAENYKKILFKHGVKEPCLGVKIDYLKKIQKRVKMDYQLALDLFDTGIYDAQYLAGLIADASRMTSKDLQRWADQADGPISGTAVAWVASENAHGWELALKWIESPKKNVAVSGWTTLSSLVSVNDDAELKIAELKKLLQRVQKNIHQAPNDVRYAMNGFVIAAGSYVVALTGSALEIGEKVGKITVDMGDTACQVPFAPDYIRKVQKRGTIGKKRKSAAC